jgi:hypothetical protein
VIGGSGRGGGGSCSKKGTGIEKSLYICQKLNYGLPFRRQSLYSLNYKRNV